MEKPPNKVLEYATRPRAERAPACQRPGMRPVQKVLIGTFVGSVLLVFLGRVLGNVAIGVGIVGSILSLAVFRWVERWARR